MSSVPKQQPRQPILFVDDSHLMRMCARKILGSSFELIIADSAETAWETLQERDDIQAVFTDLHMTGKNGYELLRMIRSSDSPGMAELPVVLITGAEDQEDKRSHALALGATDFITKPFQASELMARATAYADTGQSRQRLRMLERDHHLDAETGLGNRQYCEQRLLQAMSFAQRHGQKLSLVHIHFDGFERLLGELGEPHAGRALARIGRTLAGRVRREDTVYRSGKETFTFILPATDSEGATILQDRFVPDLAELGLGADNATLDVTARFAVQEPTLNTSDNAGEIIETGLAACARVDSETTVKLTADARGESDARTQSPPAAAETDSRAPALEEAIKLIEAGKSDEIRAWLPELSQRIRPLVDLIDQSEPDRDESGPEGEIWRVD